MELYPAIVQSLHDIAYGEDSVSWNRNTINDANGLLSAIETFSFVLMLIVVFNVLSYIKGLTVLLQQQSLDIVRGIELVQDVQEQLKELRDEIGDWHSIWFQSAIDIAEVVGTEKSSIPQQANTAGQC